ncbi:Transcription factor [Parasponia andersonii]|uniref:Transcription factor n=1 Tax=Parasponia andersonii TaxID=3476 RepID=A0A2P5D2K8_PARAD|nr:Transcription factor [Parasponia andersonii]
MMMVMRPYSLSSSSSPFLVTTQNPNLCLSHSFYSSPFPLTSGFNFDISRFSANPKSVRKRLFLKCRQSDNFEQQKFNTTTAPNNDSSFASQTSPRGGQLPARFFVGHSIYKGKAALTVEPRAPEFTALDSGAFKVSKEGFVLLQFAPAAGVRVYDWSRKQFILPHLIGWSAFANSIKPEDTSRGNNASPRFGGDYEWKR